MNTGVIEAMGRVGLAGVGIAGAKVMPPEIANSYVAWIIMAFACAAGAYSSFSFGDKVEPRSVVRHLFFACVFMGWAWTTVINGGISLFTDWELTLGTKAGMGAIISCLARFFIPELIKRIGPWLDKIPFLRKKGE